MASFVKPTDVLTGTWRDTDSPSRYSDVAVQVVRYTSNLYRERFRECRSGSTPKTPQERRDLIEALSNPLVYHRHQASYSLLYKAIEEHRVASQIVRDPAYQAEWDTRVDRAIRHSNRAWDAFVLTWTRLNTDDIVEAGGTGGMSKGDKRRRQAVENVLREMADVRQRNIRAIQQMCFMNEHGWSPPDSSLASHAYNGSLKELIDFALLIKFIDKSLRRAIFDGVAKRMVAKGERMRALDK